MSAVELVGYIASAFLMVSFSFKNIRILRTLNSLGCIAFIIYGFMLSTAWPIVITNSYILCMNIYYLFIKKDG